MTEKERQFCEMYVKSGNATAAAVQAGYSEKSARQIAYRLLKKEYIQDYVNFLRQELTSENLLSAEDLRRFWSDTAQDRSLKIGTRLQASNLLGRALGVFTERVKVEMEDEDDSVWICLPEIIDDSPDGRSDPPRIDNERHMKIYRIGEEPNET